MPTVRAEEIDTVEGLMKQGAEISVLEQMTRGWAKGTKKFKKEILQEHCDPETREVGEAEASEMRELRWEESLSRALESLGRSEDTLRNSPKGALWKVALARHLRERYLAPYRWIASNLHMGRPSSVQSLVSRHRAGPSDKEWEKLPES